MPHTIAVLALLLAGVAPALALPQPPVKVDLVTDVATLAPGQAFEAGIRLSAPPGWHVYWRNPGDVGSPPQMAWDLPPGFKAGEIRWPAPGRIAVPPMTSYAYDGGTTLVVPMTAPADLPTGGDVTLSGKLTYLACLEICVPGSADLSRTLAVGPSPVPDPAGAAVLEAAHRTLPEPLRTPVRVSHEGGTLTLGFDLPGRDAAALRNAYFYPESEGLVDASAEQAVTPVPGGFRLALALADRKAPVPDAVAGVLAFEDGGIPVALAASTATVPGAADAAASATPPPSPGEEADMTLWAALGLAFLGGLALNLMPCVFPVLSIKVLGLARQAGSSTARMRGHGLAYGAGVLTSMLGLAGALLAAKAGGAAAGWGFQLQSPAFVAVLACGLLLLGLSLSGVFHLGGRLTGAGDGLARREGFQGSFFTGVLAVLVATPCTAPFMGAAVGYALAQPATAALAVFAALGAGLALPFTALAWVPGSVRLLPRPGPWMETIKGALAFPVYATVAWLAWVLAQQVGPGALMSAFTSLVLAGFAAWCWGRGENSGPRMSFAARGLALAALLVAGGLSVRLEPAPRSAVVTEAGVEPYAPSRLAALRAEGRTVFVDLTAAWCITCQVNERTTLASREVREAFRDRDVAYLKGDWTNADPGITKLLEEQGRAGVPLYLVYRGTGAPAVLPQVLTPAVVVAALPPAAARKVGALER